MDMNKKGELAYTLLFTIIIGIIILVVAYSVMEYYSPGSTEGAEAGFEATGKVLGKVGEIIKGTLNYIYLIVAPSDLDDNEKMIAFAIFLMMFIVGAYSLRQIPAFKNPLFSILIAFLVALIGARGLTSYLIEKYIVGSSVSGMVFLAAVIPIIMMYGAMSKWRSASFLTKWIAWLFLAVIYFLVFTFGFESLAMGVTTGLFILFASLVETWAPYFRAAKEKRQRQGLGRFIFSSQKTLKSWEQVQEGASEAEHTGG